MESSVFTFTDLVDMISHVVGGLSIFLLGMKFMSDGVQATAGDKLRRMIAMVTDNRLLACATGTFVTCLIQSSSVTTVMLVGLVNAGVMNLMQSIGVILGADLGTTITAWIVAIKITKYGLLIVGVSGFIYLFTKGERTRFIAMMIMGIGLVFFGLEMMKDGMVPLRSNEGFVALFSRFSPHNYFGVVKCVLIGALITACIQSSSATVAITITLARTGVIDYNTAVALVLGENIGTTITAFIASLGMTTNARRVAYAHIMIKIIGVTLMIPFFFLFLKLLENIIPVSIDIASRIAMSHTIFNIILVCIFLPPAPLFAKVLFKLVKSKPFEERTALTHLDVRLFESPMLSIEQSRREILKMGDVTGLMLNTLREIIADGDTNGTREKIQMIFSNEELLDSMQKEVVVFLTDLLTTEITSNVAKEIHEQLRRADEYESISDYCASILKMHLRLKNAKLKLDSEELFDSLDLHDAVRNYYTLIYESHKQRDSAILAKARPQGDAITHQFREMRARHLEKLSNKQLDPLICTVYPDILAAYRRIKEHLLNVAEAVAGEK
ncbi:MAG: Na/Pi cotransporter family protein [Chitinispirillaceae bacterium]|nr:Na/Pi cotransporter family protein [Chitinispirillaceae bacterium]